MRSQVMAQAPGKLYIAGEYAVVQPGEPALVVAVDRFLTVEVTDVPDDAIAGRVHSNAYEDFRQWRRDHTVDAVNFDADFDYVAAAVTSFEAVRAERGVDPLLYDLHISSDLDSADGSKFGLGSSAAVVVAIIQALDNYYGLGLSFAERFKLAVLASVQVSPRGSGGDIAASTFGGWVFYRSPDREQLLHDLRERGVVFSLQSSAGWQGCKVTCLLAPQGMHLLVGWTGQPASTDDFVTGVSASFTKENPDYGTFLRESRAGVEALARALETSDAAAAASEIRAARQRLAGFAAGAGIDIETRQLSALCEIAEKAGAAAKPSGAGGGDCGIVLCDGESQKQQILEAWQQEDILPLPLAVTESEGESFEC
ncbi:MAG: phosphomevalonate kinase [Microbacteriaceae bacterium]|nr:phosphomevalonate kinase [Microbacteriaceae bacterium]